MSIRALPIFWLSLTLLASGCATYVRHGLDPQRAAEVERSCERREFTFAPETERQIMALNPEHVTEMDVRGVLSQTWAPRLINIHGGIYPVHHKMISFSQFLIGMGYPAASIANPGDGTYTFSCYEGSKKIAGMIAWYYEREGLRPMLIGHSQGGMQVVKVLHVLAGPSAKPLHVWNPLTWKEEASCEIVDPLTRQRRPVAGLVLSFASSVGAGGLTRILPNQWDINASLRSIPNSVDEFTGFCKPKDLLGGDYLGFGAANEFKSMDKAVVRNVWLPSSYRHGAIPNTKHLLASQEMMDWINHYRPSDQPGDKPLIPPTFSSDSRHILWAADVWYSIKKHWVLELQRLIRATGSQKEHA